jgi:hypothetical protein
MYTKWREHRPILDFISAGKVAALQTIGSEIVWSAIVGGLIGDVLGEIMSDITQGQLGLPGEVYVSWQISMIPILSYAGFFMLVHFLSDGSLGYKISQSNKEYLHDFGFEVLSFLFNVLSLLAYLQCCYYYAGFRFRSSSLNFEPTCLNNQSSEFSSMGCDNSTGGGMFNGYVQGGEYGETQGGEVSTVWGVERGGGHA